MARYCSIAEHGRGIMRRVWKEAEFLNNNHECVSVSGYL